MLYWILYCACEVAVVLRLGLLICCRRACNRTLLYRGTFILICPNTQLATRNVNRLRLRAHTSKVVEAVA